MNRRKSREVAMKLLFQMSISKDNCTDIMQGYRDSMENESDLNDIDMEYVERVLNGVQKNTEYIDNIIEKHLINWKLYRLSKVDLAILRICTYEIMFEENIPNVVSVNEAIELAKKYSDEKSASFINGVLGSIIEKKTNNN